MLRPSLKALSAWANKPLARKVSSPGISAATLPVVQTQAGQFVSTPVAAGRVFDTKHFGPTPAGPPGDEAALGPDYGDPDRPETLFRFVFNSSRPRPSRSTVPGTGKKGALQRAQTVSPRAVGALHRAGTSANGGAFGLPGAT